MRTIDLIKSLSEAELKELSKAVSENKRPGLAPLFRELKAHAKNGTEPDNAQLFKKIFGKAYSKDQDYLLRNELRLLNEVLYDYLIMSEFRKETGKSDAVYNQWLLRSFHSRKIKSLFETDIDKSIKASINENKPQETAQMYYYKSTWLIDHLPRTPENLASHMALLEDYKQEEKKRFLHRIREIESQEAYLQLSMDFMHILEPGIDIDDKRTAGATIFDLTELARTDWYSRYLQLKKHAFQTRRYVNIEVLKEKLEMESSAEHGSFFTIENRLFTMGHLAREYILLHEFEETDRYHVQMVALCREHGHPMKIGHIQNYLGNQIYLRRYTKGIAIYEEYKKTITESYIYASIAVLCSFCHLFLRQPEEALALIPPSSAMTASDQLFSRLVYPIAFYIRGDVALASAECANLRRAARANNPAYDDDPLSGTLHLLSQFLGIVGRDRYARDKELPALYDMVRQSINKTSAFYAAEFALLWLADELERLVKG